MTALAGLLRKEWFHIRRDRRTATVLVALPVVQVLLFGYAIRTDVNDVRLAVVDPAPNNVTLAIRDRFAAAGVFRVVAVVPRVEDLDPLFQSGSAQQAIVFGYDPASRPISVAASVAQLLVITDATEPNTGSLLQAYAEAVIQGYERETPAAKGPGPVRPRSAIDPTIRIVPRSSASIRRAKARTCSCPA
jgi:ABC-2 type transport system permease protein